MSGAVEEFEILTLHDRLLAFQGGASTSGRLSERAPYCGIAGRQGGAPRGSDVAAGHHVRGRGHAGLAGIARDDAQAVHRLDRPALDVPGLGAGVADPIFEPPIVVTNYDYRFLVKEQLAEIGVEARIVTEPARRDSGPAAAAVLAAERDSQSATRCRGAHKIEAFVDKPDRETAERYVAAGYLWNSGNFFFRADTMLEVLRTYEPEIVEAARAAIVVTGQDLGFLALDAEAFGKSPKKSIEYAVMEPPRKRPWCPPTSAGRMSATGTRCGS
jgi:hypothetical protein